MWAFVVIAFALADGRLTFSRGNMIYSFNFVGLLFILNHLAPAVA